MSLWWWTQWLEFMFLGHPLSARCDFTVLVGNVRLAGVCHVFWIHPWGVEVGWINYTKNVVVLDDWWICGMRSRFATTQIPVGGWTVTSPMAAMMDTEFDCQCKILPSNTNGRYIERYSKMLVRRPMDVSICFSLQPDDILMSGSYIMASPWN